MLGLFWLFDLSAEEVCYCNIEHDVSYPGVVGNTVPQSNISVNKFHLREETNASLEHSDLLGSLLQSLTAGLSKGCSISCCPVTMYC